MKNIIMLDDIHPDGERRWSSEKGIVVAVAVDKAKASQHALKWAVDHLLYKDKNKTLISLVHVRHTLPPIAYSPPIPIRNNSLVEREPYDDEMEMLRPFGGFCARRQIQFEVVVLEDDDVAQALVDYSIRHRVENLILGASSRNDLSRLFKQHSRTARTVMKWIPNFCNVYVISKLGKLSGVRNACHPVPIIPSVHDHHQTHHDILAVSRGRRPASDVGLYTDHTISESEIESCTFASPESTSPSTDGMFLSFFETLESRLARVSPPNFSSVDSLDSIQTQGILHGFYSVKTSLFLTHKLDSMQENMMKSIKSKQNQRMNKYHVACKEASMAAKRRGMTSVRSNKSPK